MEHESRIISNSSINKCWEEAMKCFIDNAYSQNICGKEYLLLNNLTIQVSGYVLDTELSKYCPWQLKSFEYYLSQVNLPGKYSEMGRMYAFGTQQINQYEYAIRMMRKRKNIKPVVIPVYDPYRDNREHVPTPCISNIILDLYNEEINMYVNYLTMNIFRMGLLDFQQMAYLHQIIARDSERKVGSLRLFLTQVHMPIFDFVVSKKLFGR